MPQLIGFGCRDPESRTVRVTSKEETVLFLDADEPLGNWSVFTRTTDNL